MITAETWPDDLSEFHHIEALGGSTGADLMEDSDGELSVLKRGADPEHALEEFYADEVYRALGVAVPRSRIYHDRDGEAVRVAGFVEGISLRDLIAYGRQRTARGVAARLQKGFAADAALANWDVIGSDFSNPLLAEDGTVYRVDNGAALRRRARGGHKPAEAFAEEVHELHTMRDSRVNHPAAWVYTGLSDREVARQVRSMIAPNGGAVLEALPGDLRCVMSARVEHMAAWSAAVLRGALA